RSIRTTCNCCIRAPTRRRPTPTTSRFPGNWDCSRRRCDHMKCNLFILALLAAIGCASDPLRDNAGGGSGGGSGSGGGGSGGGGGSFVIGPSGLPIPPRPTNGPHPAGNPGLPYPPGPTNVPQPAGTPGNLKVVNWAGFKSAVSYTFDDAQPSQIEHYAQLQATGVRHTFYITTGSGSGST